jgi:hypothetical protein
VETDQLIFLRKRLNRQLAEVGPANLSAYRSFVISALAALGTLEAVDFDGMAWAASGLP